MFYKIIAGVLSTLAVATGTVMAIPASREFVLDTLAPYSQVYEQQVDKTEELENAYNINIETLNRTREALANAQAESLSCQTELNTAKSALLSAQSDLENKTNLLETSQSDLDSANVEIQRLNNDLTNLNQQYTQLIDEYNILLSTNNQQEIDNLNMQIQDMQFQIDDLNMQLSMAYSDRDMAQSEVANLQMEIDNLNQEVMMRDDQIMMLNDQLNIQQMTIDELNAQISELENNQQQLDLGTITYMGNYAQITFHTFDENGNVTGGLSSDGTQGDAHNYLGADLLNEIEQYIQNKNNFNQTIINNPNEFFLQVIDKNLIDLNYFASCWHTPHEQYNYASNASMDIQFTFCDEIISASDLINNIDTTLPYNVLIDYSYTLDENSLITNITCNFYVKSI